MQGNGRSRLNQFQRYELNIKITVLAQYMKKYGTGIMQRPPEDPVRMAHDTIRKGFIVGGSSPKQETIADFLEGAGMELNEFYAPSLDKFASCVAESKICKAGNVSKEMILSEIMGKLESYLNKETEKPNAYLDLNVQANKPSAVKLFNNYKGYYACHLYWPNIDGGKAYMRKAEPCIWILQIYQKCERSTAALVRLFSGASFENKRNPWDFKGVVIPAQNTLNFILEKDAADSEVVFISVLKNKKAAVGIATGIHNRSEETRHHISTLPLSSRVYLKRFEDAKTARAAIRQKRVGYGIEIDTKIDELIKNPVEEDEGGVLITHYERAPQA